MYVSNEKRIWDFEKRIPFQIKTDIEFFIKIKLKNAESAMIFEMPTRVNHGTSRYTFYSF